MQLVVTKSNTLTAFSWIKQGWRLFTLQPKAFMAMSGIILGTSLLANLIPILGIFVVLLSPFLAAGYYRAASIAERGEAIAVSDIFALFSEIGKYRVLIRLAAIGVLVSIPLTLLAEQISVDLQNGITPQFTSLILLVSLLAVNFMAFAFAIPAAWVAPESSVLHLIKQSFHACWINVLPLTVYGLLIVLLAVISAPVLIIGWLIMHSVSVLSFYQMFMTLYQPQQEPNVDVVANTDAGEQATPESQTQATAEQDANAAEEPQAQADQGKDEEQNR